MNVTRLVLIVATMLSVTVGMTANAATTETGRKNLAINATAVDQAIAVEQSTVLVYTAISYEGETAVFENPIVLTPEFTIGSQSKVTSPLICQRSHVTYRARDGLIRLCFISYFYTYSKLSGAKQHIINEGARIRML